MPTLDLPKPGLRMNATLGPSPNPSAQIQRVLRCRRPTRHNAGQGLAPPGVLFVLFVPEIGQVVGVLFVASSATRTSQVALRSLSGGNEPAATFCEPVAHGFRPSHPPSGSMRSPAAFQQQSTWYSESAFQTHSRWRVPGYLIPPARCWSRGAIVRRDFQTSFWPPLVCLLSGIIATNR